jgi:bifunctional non-homologous end joining protein LigD
LFKAAGRHPGNAAGGIQDHHDSIFELKYDGFRALGYVDSGQCWLVSRRGWAYKSFPQLSAAIGAAIPGQAVLDGEIVHLDAEGNRDSMT